MSKPLASQSLFRITWPIFIEQLLFILMGTADTFMLSHVSGAAVAAVGTSNQIVNVVLLILNMVSSGSAVLIAQYLGAGRSQDCGYLAALSITINLIFGVLLSVVLVLLREWISVTMQLPPEVSKLVDTYFQLVGATLFMQALLGAASSVLRASGFTQITMFVNLGMNLLHIAGNYLFIYGALGIPQMGVFGVSISTSVSRSIAALVMFALMWRYVPFRIQWGDFVRLSGKTLWSILSIGIPSAGEPIAYQVSQIVMISFMATLGADVLATRVYVMSIMSYVIIIGMSMGFGTQILVGHLVGAGKAEKAYRLVWRSLLISLVLTVTLVGILAALARPLLGVFTNDSFILTLGSQLMLISVVLETGRTFNLVIIQSMRASGDVIFPVLMGMLFPFLLGLPLCYFLGIYLHLGLIGMWLTILADEWTRGIIMTFRWKSRVWQKKALVQPVAEVPIAEM